MKGANQQLLIYKFLPDDPEPYKDVEFRRVRDQVWEGNVLREFRPFYLAIPADKTSWRDTALPPPTPHD